MRNEPGRREDHGRLGNWRAVLGLLAALGACGSAGAACKLAKLVELPVTMVDRKPMVTAKINGVEARFAVDSGAFFSVITAANAAEYQLKLHPAPAWIRVTGIGGETQVSTTTVKVFTLAGIPFPEVEFLVGGGEVGGGSVGLIGQNVLRLGDVEYDLAQGSIRLMREDDCRKATLAYWATDPQVAVNVMDIEYATPQSPFTIGSALLNGMKIRVMFDTGADRSFVSRRAAQRAGISVDASGVIYAGASRGVGHELVKTWIAPVASFKLGSEEIRNTHLPIGESMLDTADMLIGADFFLSHHIYVASKQGKLFFTYNGGAVFNLTVAAPPVTAQAAAAGPASPALPVAAAGDAAAGDPTKAAAEFSRRGTALAARREFVEAIAALTRACELAPDVPDYFYQRGVAHAENQQPAAARADFDHTIELKADHVAALVARAELRGTSGELPQALEDLDAADRAASKEADARLRMGYDYMHAGELSQALTQFDLWITAHKADARLPFALNERCWVRTLTGRDLPQALDDCNAALNQSDKKAVESARLFNGRGLVRLRLGDYQKSIADYDTALGLGPEDPWALYGRAVDEKRLGKTAAAEADMAAAKGLWPGIDSAFESHGIHP
jgi:tetratricopeptide (TPR) repeat protein/predicted aspartyl protease